jgi:hypothetical protein
MKKDFTRKRNEEKEKGNNASLPFYAYLFQGCIVT